MHFKGSSFPPRREITFPPLYQFPLTGEWYCKHPYAFSKDKTLSHAQFVRCLPAILFVYDCELESENSMARSRRNTTYEAPEMINYTLDSEEKKRFQKWLIERGAELTVEIADLISEDWKTSITYDANNATYILAATQKAETNENYNVCVTARHAEWYTGLALLVFKIKIILKGDALKNARKDADWG